MKSIVLTVQSNGSGGFRLGINTSDSKNIFKCRKVKVCLKLDSNLFIESYTACGNPCDKNREWIKLNSKTKKPYRKKGYDINKKELNFWLSQNYPNKIKGKPRKLRFSIFEDNNTFFLEFISEVKSTCP